MNADLALLIVCCAASLVLFGLALRSRRRATAATNADEPGRAAWAARLRSGGLRHLAALLRPDDAQALQALRSRTMRAGLYGRDAVDLFLTARLIALAVAIGAALLALPLVSGLLARCLLGLIALTIGLLAPAAWLDRRAAQRQAQIHRSFPDLLELIAVCLEAGLGLEQALQRICDNQASDDLLAAELRMVLADVRVGISLEQAFRRFAARVDTEDAGALAAAVAQAATLGGQLAELLRSQSMVIRQQDLLALEERAGRSSAKLALPLSLCLLPAGLLLLIGPAYVALFHAG